jgi:tRNA threonylcarbamoyladenosine biosynthesis protein TsaB
MLDARRMEVYTAIFDASLNVIKPVNALVVTENAFDEIADKKIICFGEGAAKCKPLLEAKSSISFLDTITLSGESICMLAEGEFRKGNFADVAYCEPFYLKDFIAGAPRVKGLR